MTERKPKNPVPLSQVLNHFFHQHLEHNSDQWFGLHLWRNWSQFATNDTLIQTRPVSYQNGRLVLWVKNSVEAQELGFYTEELKQKINTPFFKKMGAGNSFYLE